MEYTEMSRKEKKYTAERKEFHDHEIRKGQMVSEYITNAQILLLIIKHKPTNKKNSQIKEFLKNNTTKPTLKLCLYQKKIAFTGRIDF